MQGDIFQLEDILSHKADDPTVNTSISDSKPAITSFVIEHPYKVDDESPFIAVYNEDDISEYLYHEKTAPVSYAVQPITATPPPALVKATPNVQEAQHYLEAIATAFDDYYTDCPCVISPEAAAPNARQLQREGSDHFSIYRYSAEQDSDYYDNDECAISSDDEDEDAINGPLTPTHEIRHYHTHHIGSPPDSDLPPMRPVLEKRKRNDRGRAPPQKEHVWPSALKTVVVPREQHVDHIEGRLMSWWPLPVDQLEYDWNEKFYE